MENDQKRESLRNFADVNEAAGVYLDSKNGTSEVSMQKLLNAVTQYLDHGGDVEKLKLLENDK